MKLAWITDPHLDHIEEAEREIFYEEIADAAPDAVVITGDISEAPTFAKHLNLMGQRVGVPIYFVMGNHDFYKSSIEASRQTARTLTELDPRAKWLPAVGIVPLTEETCLIGHDGWYDGRLGDYHTSRVELNDFYYINDFAIIPGGSSRLALMRKLADEAAEYVRGVLAEALGRFQRVIVATHVPPFEEASTHEGKISNPAWMPFFSCKAMGDVFLAAAKAASGRSVTVLCGHSHSPSTVRPCSNLLVRTGGARYGKPQVQEVLTIR